MDRKRGRPASWCPAGGHSLHRSQTTDAYRFYEFLLTNFKQANWGWAHWDFDSTNPPHGGAFINNERVGGIYEDFLGYQLDRTMLQLFQAN